VWSWACLVRCMSGVRFPTLFYSNSLWAPQLSFVPLPSINLPQRDESGITLQREGKAWGGNVASNLLHTSWEPFSYFRERQSSLFSSHTGLHWPGCKSSRLLSDRTIWSLSLCDWCWERESWCCLSTKSFGKSGGFWIIAFNITRARPRELFSKRWIRVIYD
jgi:hypothetical protein